MNNRAERRIEAGKSASATILGHPDVTVTCHIRDFSRSGMCITLDHEVDRGKIVKVDWDNHFLIGRVQRVSTAESSRKIGLELLYCSKWSDDIVSLLGDEGGTPA